MAPNIRTLDAPQGLGLQPTETGIDATTQAARRIGAFYGQAAEDYRDIGSRVGSAIRDAGDVAVQYVQHQEISKGAKDWSEMQLDLTKQWDDLAKNADPNDPSVAAKFREQTLEPALDKFKEKFSTQGGQQWAEQHVDALRTHMFQKTAADQSTLAGEAVKVNAAKVINASAATARLDPSSLDFQLKTVDSALKGVIESSPTLTPDMAAKVSGEVLQKAKEGIVKSAVIGMIEKNPNIDLSVIEKKYSDYISGPEMQMFQKSAQVQQRKDLLMEKQAALLQKQQAELKTHADANKNFTDNVSIDPQTHRPIINPRYFNGAVDIAKNNPDAPNAQTTARTMLDWGEHQQNLKDESPRTDPAVKQDFVDRMFSPDNPTTEIQLMKAQVDGKLNKNDFAAMHQLVRTLEETPLKGPVWHDTVEAVKAEMTVSGINLPGKDVVGIANYAKWAQTFIPQYQAMYKAGTLPPDALDVKNPDSLISKSMAPFKRTVSQKMQDYVDLMGGMSADTPVAPKSVQTTPALPAPDARKKGQVYPTARGQMKWTGTGWVAP